MKTTMWKVTRRLIKKSLGRFLSIMLLTMLGSMTLIGLKSAGPDINRSANEYFERLSAMDLAVIGSQGLGAADEKEIREAPGVSEVEFGNFVDTTIANSSSAIRIYSAPRKLSKFEVVRGKMPAREDEIALTDRYRGKYKIGDIIEFAEKRGVTEQLKRHTYRVTGFINSTEIIADNTLGPSNAGTGALSGYAVVSKSAFKQNVPVIARIRFKDLKDVDRFGDSYTHKLKKHSKELEKLLSDNAADRKIELEKNLRAQYEKGMAGSNTSGFYTGQAKIGENHIDGKENYPLKISVPEPEYHVYTYRTMPGSDGVKMLRNMSFGVGKVGNVFPIVLYLVAALVTVANMTRFVYEERTNAGVMKALGYTEQDVTKQFVTFGLCSGGIGSFLGVLLGTYGIPYVLCSSLMANMTMPIPALKFNWTIVGIAVFLSLSCTVLPVLAIVHREFKANAAQLLLPKPPSSSSRILIERVKFIWKRMSFIQKVTARNIFRYKQRMLMTIFGVIGSVALLCAGLGISSSVNDIEGRQFGDLIKHDVVVTKSEGITNDEQIKLDKVLKSSSVAKYEDVYIKQVSQQIKGVDDEQDITIMATSEKSFAPLIDIKTKDLHNSIALPKNGVVITEKLAKLLGVSKGDTFNLNDGGKTYAVRVSEIAEMYAGHYVFVSDDYYSQVWGESPAANSYLVKVNEKSEIANVASKFMNLEGVKGVAHNLNIIDQVRGVSKSLLSVMLVLTIMSMLLAIVILYNLTNINMVERVREISTVKVLGFLNKEATMYIYRETVILSIIGIVLGLISGKMLHDFIIAYVAPPHVMFTPNIELWGYIVPSIAVIGILCVLCVYVNRMIRKLNMLDALKSVD